MQLVQANETDAARRTVSFFVVDATDGFTPELLEAGGQPQVSTDGGVTWADAGIGTLGGGTNGYYAAVLTQALVAAPGTVVRTRYKSARTAECPGDSVQVVGFDPDALVPEEPVITPAADPAQTTGYLTTRDGQGAAKANVTLYFRLVNPSGTADAYERLNFAATSNGAGLLEVALKQVSAYQAKNGPKGEWVPFTTGSAATYALPEILGSYGS